MTDTPRTDEPDDECDRCGEVFEVPVGLDPSKYCNLCAQALVETLEPALSAALPDATPPVSEEREEVAQRVFLACVGSCTCMTKTPEPEHHKTDCLYRVLSDAYRLLRAPQQQAEPVAWIASDDLLNECALDLDMDCNKTPGSLDLDAVMVRLELIRLEGLAARAGLYGTMHAINKAKQKLGWETARIIERKR